MVMTYMFKEHIPLQHLSFNHVHDNELKRCVSGNQLSGVLSNRQLKINILYSCCPMLFKVQLVIIYSRKVSQTLILGALRTMLVKPKVF